MTPRQQIASLDKQIDAIRRELLSRAGRRLETAGEWQDAWYRHPDLRNREVEMFRQRGLAQQERDIADFARIIRQPRARRPKKCPTCGQRTLAA